MKEKTENVRVDSSVLNEVRDFVKVTRQTVGGFATMAIEEKLEREKGNQSPELVIPPVDPMSKVNNGDNNYNNPHY